MSENPYKSSESPGAHLPRKRRLALSALIFTGIGAVAAALLLLPLTRSGAGRAARRMACQNNLKQIALGLQAYADHYGTLPPAYTVDAEGRRLHSWRTLLLPFVEQQAVYDQIDLDKAWDDPVNQRAAEAAGGSWYQCPSATCPPNHTTYVAVIAPTGCFTGSTPQTLDQQNSGHRVLLVDADAAHCVHWMEPQDVDSQWLLNLSKLGQTPHRDGVQIATSDCSVHFLSLETSVEAIRELLGE